MPPQPAASPMRWLAGENRFFLPNFWLPPHARSPPKRKWAGEWAGGLHRLFLELLSSPSLPFSMQQRVGTAEGQLLQWFDGVWVGCSTYVGFLASIPFHSTRDGAAGRPTQLHE